MKTKPLDFSERYTTNRAIIALQSALVELRKIKTHKARLSAAKFNAIYELDSARTELQNVIDTNNSTIRPTDSRTFAFAHEL